MLIGPRNLTVEGRLIEALMNRCGSEKRVKAMSLFVPREERRRGNSNRELGWKRGNLLLLAELHHAFAGVIFVKLAAALQFESVPWR